ncbi:alpha-glycosidase [Domibacillus aminovorans]|uniref:Alpha-glycosidase n=1 Tax=Domibacillus aminovorans TaxID=29332 RepID=A0A177KMZ3_9BACI|nr:alpha-glycosidase [Domibacillus aminovorans]OAH54739.1 alpha-glycosidase [Domibacillus aminovorans]
MLKEAIYHRPKNNFAYLYDEEAVHIRIRSKKNDLRHVILLYGDPYNWKDEAWQYKTKEMKHSGSDELFDYWFAAFKPSCRRIRYGFKCVDDERSVFYTERGFYNEAPKDCAIYFSFPFLHAIDIFRAPDWVKKTVWYQIFPERFEDGEPSINHRDTQPWGAEPKKESYFGGDFQGIIKRLTYLENLGINGIYFTPIFRAETNHKYDTTNYLEIDPQFGDKRLLKKLVQECHKRGIRVMLDAVFNHSGYCFAPFQDVVKNQEKSSYKDWFHIRKFPLKEDGNLNYDAFGFEEAMPKLNTEHPEVKKYLLNVAKYWIEEFDIDAWRLDVANEVSHHFWREFRQTVKTLKPDIYLVGEIWHDSMPWLQGDQFDAVMNYRFSDTMIDFFAREKRTVDQFKHEVVHIMQSYPLSVNEVAFNLLGSHDTPRILTTANENKERLKLMYLFQFSVLGTPCIYYGDEIGMTGEQDPDCRKCMIWNEEEQDLDLFNFVKKLIAFRKEIRAFGNEGDFTFINIHPSVISYVRKNESEQLLFMINPTDQPVEVHIPIEFRGATEIWTNSFLTEYTSRINQKGFIILYSSSRN